MLVLKTLPQDFYAGLSWHLKGAWTCYCILVFKSQLKEIQGEILLYLGIKWPSCSLWDTNEGQIFFFITYGNWTVGLKGKTIRGLSRWGAEEASALTLGDTSLGPAWWWYCGCSGREGHYPPSWERRAFLRLSHSPVRPTCRGGFPKPHTTRPWCTNPLTSNNDALNFLLIMNSHWP